MNRIKEQIRVILSSIVFALTFYVMWIILYWSLMLFLKT
jgi:hypothetical protein